MYRYRRKGRYVSKRFYQALCRGSENAKGRLQKLLAKKLELEAEAKKMELEAEADKSVSVVKGSRIVDKEKITGLVSTFSVECRNCLLMNTVTSGKDYKIPSTGKTVFAVNTKTVLGKKY